MEHNLFEICSGCHSHRNHSVTAAGSKCKLKYTAGRLPVKGNSKAGSRAVSPSGSSAGSDGLVFSLSSSSSFWVSSGWSSASSSSASLGSGTGARPEAIVVTSSTLHFETISYEIWAKNMIFDAIWSFFLKFSVYVFPNHQHVHTRLVGIIKCDVLRSNGDSTAFRKPDAKKPKSTYQDTFIFWGWSRFSRRFQTKFEQTIWFLTRVCS